MKRMCECPICNHRNILEYFCEDIGLVENYYHCKHCGYWEHMCYSSILYGISTKFKFYIRYILRYRKKFKERNIKFVKDSETP